MTIQTDELPNFSIRDFYALYDEFDFDPPYQREGDVWNLETKQLFIDSIINDFLIPRVYIEQTALKEQNSTQTNKRWSILDGKQRLQTIIEFEAGKFSLSEDFIYFDAPDAEDEANNDSARFKCAGKNITDLRRDHPEIAQKFDTFIIPAVIIKTTSTDEVEEMFARLNSASDLNAAERRNAVNCHLRTLTNQLAQHDFFTSNCPIKDARYKYREIASKLIVTELQYATSGRLHNLKAKTLMKAFQSSKAQDAGYTDTNVSDAHSLAKSTLNRMSIVFNNNDPLLRSIGSLVVYYLCFREDDISTSRDRIEQFEKLRRDQVRNDRTSEEPDTSNEARLLRLYNGWVQSSNDGRALEERACILKAYLSHDDDTWATVIASKILVSFSEEVGSTQAQSHQPEAD